MRPLCTVLNRSNRFFRQQRRFFAAQFDGEMSEIYSKMAAQHHHPKGPWNKILKVVQAELPGDGQGKTVLDIASGPGEPALSIAKALPGASVISTDISPDMSEKAVAAAAAAGVTNMTARVVDAVDMSEFKDGTLDAVTCCYGYMFPEDKQKALDETIRVLKPGGVLVATTWDRVDMVSLAGDIMTAVLGKKPPPPPINPMSLAEPGLFEGMLEKAGFSGLEVTTSTYPFNFGSEKDFQVKIGTILLRDKLKEMDAIETGEKAFWDNVGKYTTTDANGDMLLPENTFKMVVARKP